MPRLAPLLALGAPPLRTAPPHVEAWATERIEAHLCERPETLLVFVDGTLAERWSRAALAAAGSGRPVVYTWRGAIATPRGESRWTDEPAPVAGEHRALVAAWGLHRERVMVQRVAALAKAGHEARVVVFEVPRASAFDRVPGEHMTLRAQALGLAVEVLTIGKPAPA